MVNTHLHAVTSRTLCSQVLWSAAQDSWKWLMNNGEIGAEQAEAADEGPLVFGDKMIGMKPAPAVYDNELHIHGKDE